MGRADARIVSISVTLQLLAPGTGCDSKRDDPVTAASSSVATERLADPAVLRAVAAPSTPLSSADGLSITIETKGSEVVVSFSNDGPGTLQGDFELTPVWVGGAPWRAIEEIATHCTAQPPSFRAKFVWKQALMRGGSSSWTWLGASDTAWYCDGQKDAYESPPAGLYRIRMVARLGDGGMTSTLWSPQFQLPR